MKKLLLVIMLALGLQPAIATADTGSAAALVDAGVTTSPAASPAPAPPVLTDNPVAHPGDALSELELARKSGWAVAVLAGLVMLMRGLASLGSQVSFLAFLQNGKTAAITAGVLAVAIASYGALAAGGTWAAAGLAAVVALAHFFDAKPKPAAA